MNTGADQSIATNLTSINAGWAGGTGGNGYGINCVGATTELMVNGFYVLGAARNGVNQSDSGSGLKLLNGIVKYSAAGGVKSTNSSLQCTNVVSKYNVGEDFEPAGTTVMHLINCEDTRGFPLNNERVITTSRNEQPVQSLRV